MGTLIGLQQFKFWYNLVTLKLRNEWLLIINDGKAIIPAGILGSHNCDDHFKSTLYLPSHGNDGSWGLVSFSRPSLLITKLPNAVINYCKIMSRLETVNVVMSEARQEIIKCEYVQPKSGNDIDPPSPSPNIIGVTWPCEMENLLLIPRSTGEFDFWWSALLF